MGIPKAVTAAESVTLVGVDPKVWLNYLEQVCEVFRGEIPHVKHPKLDLEKLRETKREAPDFSNLLKLKSQSKDVERQADEPERERPRRSRRFDTSAASTPRATPDAPSRRSRKRRSYDKFGNIVSCLDFFIFLYLFY